MIDLEADDGNAIININSLKALLQPHLINCDVCKDSQLILENVKVSSICQKLRLTCPKCHISNQMTYQSMNYLKKTIPELHGTERKKKVRQLANMTKAWNEIIKPSLVLRDLDVGRTSYFKENTANNNSLQYDINTRLFVSPFLTGTGFDKATGILACLNIEGTVGTKRSFYTHQSIITSDIIKTTTAVIKEAQVNEIKATILERLEEKGIDKDIQIDLYHKWLEGHNVKQIGNVGLTVSFDMAWQKRGSGSRYDSLSGHGIMIGCRTKKVIGIIVYAMKCSKCHFASKKCVPAEEHDCPLNYVGSSKGMEATAALEMVIDIYTTHTGRIYVEAIISDDDSTMRAKVSHETNNVHGKLPAHIPAPIFKADPGHRIKSMSRPFFELAKAAKSTSTLEMSDAMQYRMYIGCCIKKNRHLSLEEFKIKMRAPVEHIFGCHEWCDKEWCWSKELDDVKSNVNKKFQEMYCMECDNVSLY